MTLQSSLADIFDIYRLLLPTHFDNQITNVPAIAFQVYNDHYHLAQRIKSLQLKYEWWNIADILERMDAGAERVFEDQIGVQVAAFLGILAECRGFADVGSDIGYSTCERAVKEISHNMETLAKVLKVISDFWLPLPTAITIPCPSLRIQL